MYFKTIYPGWYRGHTTHVHVRAHHYDANRNTTYDWTTQLFFDDTICDAMFANAPYTRRAGSDVYNSTGNVYSGGGSQTLLALTKTDNAIYTDTATLSLSLATAND